jgi:AcrR family transcriptional regulator
MHPGQPEFDEHGIQPGCLVRGVPDGRCLGTAPGFAEQVDRVDRVACCEGLDAGPPHQGGTGAAGQQHDGRALGRSPGTVWQYDRMVKVPKQVDHELRRREITEAICRIAAANGLEAVTLGQVATEAGISKGLVQHYFRSRDEMLVYTTSYLRESVERRIATRAGDATLRNLLAALLPADEQARVESLVANAFFIRALKDPAIAERFVKGDALLRAALVERFSAAQAAGDLAAELDPVRETDILLAMVAGLSQSLLLGRHTPDSALATLDHQLARLGTA